MQEVPEELGCEGLYRDAAICGADSGDVSEEDAVSERCTKGDLSGCQWYKKPKTTTLCVPSTGTCDYRCADYFGNCDNDWSNGCEVDLSQSIKHCGTCGNGCSVSDPNLVSVCRDKRASGAITPKFECDVKPVD